jgi:glycerate 2-kinase
LIIKNRDQLLSHGNTQARHDVLDILEAGLQGGDPYQRVRELVRIEGNRLIVGNEEQCPVQLEDGDSAWADRPIPSGPLVFNLDDVGHIYVVGGGKAAQRQALALEEVLGDRITAGQVNAKKGDQIYLKRIPVTLAGHPLPDEDSVIGAKRILAIETSARKGDIVFLTESGGGSALMALPAPGVSLHDLQEVNRILYFGCGASMPETNAVRNLMSVVRLRHARHVGDATLIHIATTELPLGLRVHLSWPSQQDDPYQYAIELLKRYGCWDDVPQSVRDFLLRADPEYLPVRPDEWYDKPRYRFRVMGPEYMLDAALSKARSMGLQATILVSSLSDVEAQPVANTLAYVAQEMEAFGRPLQPPCVLLCGGELVVSTGKEPGLGGRNQEFVLASALRIAGSHRIVIASADSDGSDGPTSLAGGIVDGYTMERARQAGIDVSKELQKHNSTPVLLQLGDAIDTGVGNTNIRDLRVIYVGEPETATDLG